MTGWPWILAGIGTGLLNVLLLKASLDRVSLWPGDKRWLWLGAGMAVRLMLVLGVLVLAAQQGFAEVLFAFIGFWLARWPLLYWLSQRPERK